MIDHHTHRALADLRRKLVRCLAHIGSTFSGVGASGEPGPVQTGKAIGAEVPAEWESTLGSLYSAPCGDGVITSYDGFSLMSFDRLLRNFPSNARVATNPLNYEHNYYPVDDHSIRDQSFMQKSKYG